MRNRLDGFCAIVAWIFAGLFASVALAGAPAGRGAVRMILPDAFIDKTPPTPATSASDPMGSILLLAVAPPAPDALVKRVEILGVQSMMPKDGSQTSDDALKPIADATQKQAEKDLQDAKTTDAGDFTLDGAKAYRFTVTGMKENMTFRELTIVAIHKGVPYKIQYAAEGQAFDKHLPDIEKALGSFQWIDAAPADNK